jgi:hypothetical protein
VLGEVLQEVELPPAQRHLGAVPVDGTRAAAEPYRVGVGEAVRVGGVVDVGRIGRDELNHDGKAAHVGDVLDQCP